MTHNRYRTLHGAGLRGTVIAAVVLVLVLSAGTSAAKTRTYRLTHITEDFATTKWTLQCVPRGTLDLAALALSDEGYRALVDCVADVEIAATFQLRSRSKVKRGRGGIVTVSDRIKTVSRLTAEQVEKIKAVAEDPANQVSPVLTVAPGPSRLLTKFADGKIRELVVTNLRPGLNTNMLDLDGDGVADDPDGFDAQPIDTDGDLIPDAIDLAPDATALPLLLDDLVASGRGEFFPSLFVDETGVSRDSLSFVAPLTDEDHEALLQILALDGQFILPDAFTTPALFSGRIKVPGGDTIRIETRGTVRIDPNPTPPPAGGIDGTRIEGIRVPFRDGDVERIDVVRLVYLLRGLGPYTLVPVNKQPALSFDADGGDFRVDLPQDRAKVLLRLPLGKKPMRIKIKGKLPAVPAGGDSPVGTFKLKKFEVGSSGWTIVRRLIGQF